MYCKKCLLCLVLSLLCWGCDDKDKPSQNSQTQPKTISPPTPSNSQSNDKARKTPAQDNLQKPKLNSDHLADWQALLDRFYSTECEIKEALKPIYTHEKELQILNLYLPQIYTSSLCQWFMQCNEGRLITKNIDPPFPVGPIEISKIEKQTPEAAVIIATVRFHKRQSGEYGYHLYKIRMKREFDRWVIDHEEQIQTVSNVTSTLARNIFGHLQVAPVVQIEQPNVNTTSPEQLLNSMIQIARYLQVERNKLITTVLPPLIPKVQPLLSQNYYREISEKMTLTQSVTHLKIEKFEEKQPEKGLPRELVGDEICYCLTMDTFRMPGNEPFRPYVYYWILTKDAKGWKLDLEIGKQIGRFPSPRPFFYNLLYWNLPEAFPKK